LPILSLRDGSGRSDESTSIVPYFGTEAISSGSSTITKPITTNIGVTPGWRELRLLNAAVHLLMRSQKLSHIPGSGTAMACLRPRLPPELRFATDRRRDRPTAPRSPWQNGHVERLIG